MQSHDLGLGVLVTATALITVAMAVWQAGILPLVGIAVTALFVYIVVNPDLQRRMYAVLRGES